MRPHGVKGELRLKLFNADSDVLLSQDEVLVRLDGGEEHEVSVDSARRASDAILMKLYSIDDRDRADELRGALVCARRSSFPELEADEFYGCDVLGARVLFPDGGELGTVRELLNYPASDVLVVRAKDGGKDWEVPLMATFVAKVDVALGVVHLVTLDGLARGSRSVMQFDLVTLFPELFETFLATSLVGRAVKTGKIVVRSRSPRDFGLGRHKSVDDTPYGGGSGMVMRVDVMVACMEAMDADAGGRAHRVLLTPQGAPLDQVRVRRMAERPRVMLISGRYEGFDERVRASVDEEISLGDFVLTGGEVAAMAVIEACVRCVPGVLGNEESAREESFSPDTLGLLEYPQYTRPAEFRGMTVPATLQSGHHAEIERWRKEQALERTRLRRPDLVEKLGKGK